METHSGAPDVAFETERPEESICTTASDGTFDGSDESEAVQLKLLRQQMYSKN